MISYFAETVIVGGSLWCFWRVVLRGKVAEAWSRRYLVVALLLTVLLPALDIPLYPAPAADIPTVSIVAPRSDIAIDAAPAAIPATEIHAAVDWRRLSRAAYLAVCLIFAVLFAVRVIRISLLRRRAHLTRCRHYTLACHAAIRTPFSFLRTIFLGEGVEGRNREVVIMHEASHIRHGHSRERIAAEIVRIVLWLNPFVWLTARSLEEVHECEADADVLDSGCDMREYRLLILNQLFGCNPDIACGLGNSLTKNRFIMMTRSKRHRHAALRLGAAIPLVVAMMMLCSFTTRTPEPPAAAEPVAADVANPANPENGELQIVEIKLLNSGGMTIDGDHTLETLSAARRNGEWIAVRIKAENKVKMERITDLKEQLRELELYRVQYASAGGKGGQTRMLPPQAGGSNGVEVLSQPRPADGGGSDEFTIARRNLFYVGIDSRGECVAGAGRSAVVDAATLKAEVKHFVLNAGGDKALSASRDCEFTLPDGRKEHYPVSEGLVMIECAADAPYKAYLSAQQAVGGAFEELREELAHRWFDRGYRSLSMAERDVVARAIPIKVSEAEPRK